MKLTRRHRTARLGQCFEALLEMGTVEQGLFIYDDDGFVTDSDTYSWEYDEEKETFINEENETMEEYFKCGIWIKNSKGYTEKYQFKGHIRIYGSQFGKEGIFKLKTIEMYPRRSKLYNRNTFPMYPRRSNTKEQE